MSNPSKTAQERKISVRYDNRGRPCWTTRMTPPDDSVGVCNMVPDRVIPVIFVPGVMGSNLQGVGEASGVTWRLDSSSTMASWMTRGPEARKRYLRPTTMRVDDGGKIPEGTSQSAEELKRRGWGEVGAMSYSEFLVWLENALNDFDHFEEGERVRLMSQNLGAIAGERPLAHEEVALSYRYRFPVHACGYNWLDSNVVAAQRLAAKIDEIKARYRRDKILCEKVIVVTHSMGGLVARYCSEVLGRSKDILGIVHGVMPAIGAAAVYRRFKSGTEGAYLASEVLGNDAAEMTAVLSSAPGPLQLLPSPEYGNRWLKIKDGKTVYSFPEHGNPYDEIYLARGRWWGMCEEKLMNPLNKEHDQAARAAITNRDWMQFQDVIARIVKNFHRDISGKYHIETHAFFGSHEKQKSYGTVMWTGNGGSWLRGKRSADVLAARSVEDNEIKTERTVAAKLDGSGFLAAERQTYTISEPDEPGDGTVPHRSGVAPRQHCKSFLQVQVGHEPAYKLSEGEENQRACRFTLRAIVRIAQGVQATSLRYDS